MTTGIPLNYEYSRRGLGMFICFELVQFTGLEQGNPNSSPNLFNPSSLSVDNWVTAAQALGAKYAVFTAKHSDGFCMWPTATTPYSIASASPWYAAHSNRDIVSEFVTKFNAAGIQPVIYFSIGDATFQQSQGKSISSFIIYSSGQLATLQADYNQAAYLVYLQAQMTELLTNYGPIFGLWLDAGYWAMANTYYPWASAAAMLSFIHGLQPNCRVLNNAHTSLTTDTDLIVFEGGGAGNPPAGTFVPQEFCDTIQANNHWFWQATTAFKSTASIVSDYQKCNAVNCAYLLNAPPDNTGVIPTGTITALQQIGAAL